MVEYRNQFLKKTKAIKSYPVEFKEDGSMKSKVNAEDFAVGGTNRQTIIFFTNDERVLSMLMTVDNKSGKKKIYSIF